MAKRLNEKAIIDFYEQRPMPVSEAATHFNLCNVTVSRVLKRNNVHMYSRQELVLGDLKTSYFENIDTETKAYLLGLFMADGCVYINEIGSKLFVIQLQVEDSYMIQFIKDELGAERKIVIDKRDGSSSISIINNDFVSNLEKHGVTENKLTRFIPEIDESLRGHFLRGLLDGDGSITYRKDRKEYDVVFSAHNKVAQQMRCMLINTLDINKNSLSFEDNLETIRWRKSEDVVKIIHYLYDDSHIYLHRKHEKAMSALKKYEVQQANTEESAA